MDNGIVKIRAFRAIEDVESSEKFVQGHQRVLSAHGIKKATTLKADWMDNPNVFVVLVESNDGKKVYGGSRVHVAGGTQRLPIEDATGKMDPYMHDIVEREAKKGTGELCGLWNSIEVAGLGIGSLFPSRAGVVLCEQLGLSSLFALCAPYTVRWADRGGLKVIKDVGNEGTFYYPKLDLIATATLLRDAQTLDEAKNTERRKIMELRENLQMVQYDRAPGRKLELNIEYDLKLYNIQKDEFQDPTLPPIQHAETLPSL